jgi:CRISPR/Cas system-associated exonuclease Cas4 (RecB family)
MSLIDHLSVSQINMFSRCEFQWFFRYIEKLKIIPSSALIRGKAVHSGLADIYYSKQKENKYYPDRVVDIVAESVEKSDEQEDVKWDKPKDKTKDIAVKLISSYINNNYPDAIESASIEQVEQRIDYNLFTDKGEDFKIIGYPDLILKDRIVDFKTANRKPSGIDMQYKFQTAFYTTVTEKNNIELQYLIAKKEPEIITLSSSVDNNIKAISRNIFIKTYKKIKASIHSGNFLPTGLFHPWACRYCGYADGGKCLYRL